MLHGSVADDELASVQEVPNSLIVNSKGQSHQEYLKKITVLKNIIEFTFADLQQIIENKLTWIKTVTIAEIKQLSLLNDNLKVILEVKFGILPILYTYII